MVDGTMNSSMTEREEGGAVGSLVSPRLICVIASGFSC